MTTQKQTQVTVSGLAQSPNPFGALPPGTCSVADNVVIRRKGVMSPLEALEEISDAEGPLHPTGNTPVKIFSNWNQPYFASIEKQTADLNGNSIRFSDSTTVYTTMTVGTTTRTLAFEPGFSHATVSRSRHIFTEHSAPIVMDMSGTGHATTLRAAGLPPPCWIEFTPVQPPDTTHPKIVTSGNFTAYRATYRRITDNFQLESAPTPAAGFSVAADSGATVVVVFDPADPIAAGDYVVVYREKQQATLDALGDQFQEAVVYQLSSADIAAGSVTIIDTTVDENLGTTLYTNSELEGASQANLMPPSSVDVATYQDTTFYATRNSWPTVSLAVASQFGAILSTTTTRQNGIGQRFFNGDLTLGSPDITNVSASDAVGLCIGQLITGAFPVPTYITGITGSGPYTIHCDHNATTTAVAALSVSTDTIQITASKDGVTSTETVAIDGSLSDLASDLATLSTIHGLKLLLANLYDVDTLGATGLQFGIWSPNAGLWDSFQLRVTNAPNYSPRVQAVSGLGLFNSIQDTKRNRLFFSKTSLPEAVAPVNFLDVGAETILKMWPNQSALMVLCTDGLYRITGDGTNWAVNQLDRTCTLVHPDAVGALDNQIYAWITDGLAAIDENGATTISTDAVGPAIKDLARQVRVNLDVSGEAIWGPQVIGDNFRKEVWLNITRIFAGGTNWLQTYLFNNETGSFTTQSATEFTALSFAPTALTTVAANSPLQMVFATTGGHYWEANTAQWAKANVQFNPIVAGDTGVLKQWIDTNWFFDEVTFANDAAGTGRILLYFDNLDVLGTQLLRNAEGYRKLHFWTPRQFTSKEQLSLGFKTLEDPSVSVFFNLYGFTVRFRVASETFKR